ncbi:MAG: hypothetical protein KatS3mg081_1629 [Gemmatimonadales bacterium]|nr:MAG: hypothetical protein KatS3mg081_1629 [Gemmatimonadales bacterium]
MGALYLALAAAWLSLSACSARTAATEGTDAGPAPAPQPDSPAAQAAPQPATAAQATHQHGHGPTLPATAGPGYTEADVRFMQDMIGHHEQAITMARMALTHGAGEEVRRLAQKIDVSQRDEIAMMENWLKERGQVVPDPEYRRTKHMPGMLTPEQMAELDAARGAEFDRLFLKYMIQHHGGALEMVAQLFASPGAGQDPDVFRFATDVDADQRAEIALMHALLDRLAAGERRPDP